MELRSTGDSPRQASVAGNSASASNSGGNMDGSATDRPLSVVPQQNPLLQTMALTLPAERVQVYDGCVIVFDDVAEPLDYACPTT